MSTKRLGNTDEKVVVHVLLGATGPWERGHDAPALPLRWHLFAYLEGDLLKVTEDESCEVTNFWVAHRVW